MNINMRIIKYGFVGIISTFIHLSIAWLYIYFVNNSLFQSNIMGFLIAYLFSYSVQSVYVFEHKVSLKKALKFFIVQLSALLLAILLSYFIDRSSYIETVFIIIVMPLITFVIHKFWTFKRKE